VKLSGCAGTIGKRFDKISVKNEEDNRRAYRQLLFKAGTEMAKHISGVIMFDETFFQKADDGTPLTKVLQDIGVIPGIKVDKGTVTLAGTDDEFTTQGLWSVGDLIQSVKWALICLFLLGRWYRAVGSSLTLVRQTPSSSLPCPSLPPIHFLLSPFVVVGPSFFSSTLYLPLPPFLPPSL